MMPSAKALKSTSPANAQGLIHMGETLRPVPRLGVFLATSRVNPKDG